MGMTVVTAVVRHGSVSVKHWRTSGNSNSNNDCYSHNEDLTMQTTPIMNI